MSNTTSAPGLEQEREGPTAQERVVVWEKGWEMPSAPGSGAAMEVGWAWGSGSERGLERARVWVEGRAREMATMMVWV